MRSFLKAIINILKRGGFAFINYPVSMFFAICLAFLSIWMIYSAPLTNYKLFYSLQWTFAFGAFLNMALCVISKKVDGRQSSFITANIGALLISTGTFFAIYFAKGSSISENSMTRVLAATVISFLVFLFVPTFKSRKIQYNQMIFMTVKSFFIAAVYALVIMLGFFFVAFAVQSLLYEKMSNDIYSYISILSGLLGYAFFLGYFPDFLKEEDASDERIDKAIKQPRFAEILFQNIMIPILAALTIVLLIWSIRILITRVWPDYSQTIAIFTTYSLVGIFLYLLVSSYDNIIVRLYKRIIPLTTLLFLAFEAYTIINRISLFGVKPAEYGVSFLWLFAAVSSVIFIFIPVRGNRVTSYVAIALIAVFVMPVIGASDASFSLQSKRLENLLVQNEMLKDGKITSNQNVSSNDKIDITDATEYLYKQENKTAPGWLVASLPSINEFTTVYGFNPEYSRDNGQNPINQASYVVFRPDYSPIPLDGYQYFITRELIDSKNEISIDTDKGRYTFQYNYSSADIKAGTGTNTPELVIKLKNREVLNKNLDDFKSALISKYPVGFSDSNKGDRLIPIKDMTCVISGESIQVMLVFQSITFTTESSGKQTIYFETQGIYFKEIN